MEGGASGRRELVSHGPAVTLPRAVAALLEKVRGALAGEEGAARAARHWSGVLETMLRRMADEAAERRPFRVTRLAAVEEAPGAVRGFGVQPWPEHEPDYVIAALWHPHGGGAQPGSRWHGPLYRIPPRAVLSPRSTREMTRAMEVAQELAERFDPETGSWPGGWPEGLRHA